MTPLEKQVLRELRARLRLANEHIAHLEVQLVETAAARNQEARRRRALAAAGQARSLRWRMERNELLRQLAEKERRHPKTAKRCQWCGQPAFGPSCSAHIDLMGTADLLEGVLTI